MTFGVFVEKDQKRFYAAFFALSAKKLYLKDDDFLLLNVSQTFAFREMKRERAIKLSSILLSRL